MNRAKRMETPYLGRDLLIDHPEQVDYEVKIND